jgi:thiamine transport system substrate-binding protein
MRQLRTLTALLTALALIVTACGEDDPGQTGAPETLTILAHDSFANAVDDETFASFTEVSGIEVEVLGGGDAGSVVNQAVLSADNPIADVLFGIDDTFLSRAIDEEIFVAHASEHIDAVSAELRYAGDSVTPIDYGDVCFNYDKAYFADSSLEIPDDLDDLTADEYGGLVTIEHPATSSPGLAFMLATIDRYGEDGWLEWWEEMKDGGINVVSDWETAYYSEFTRYGGDSAIVMSYASSPPAEVIFAEEPLDEAPTGVIEAGCYRQIEYAGVLHGTEWPESAGDLIDFMLSVEFQERIPETWFVFPANQEAELPQTFVDHTVIPEDPADLDPEAIADNRERWIDEWIAVMEG